MTDVLIIAGFLLVLAPLWLLSPFVFLPLAGLVLIIAGVVREVGEQ